MMTPVTGVAADPIFVKDTVAGAVKAVPQGQSFSDMFTSVASGARDAMKAGEAASIKGISGEASVQEVVEAMMSAEQQLRAAIAVRDRVVSAYQEVARMQI